MKTSLESRLRRLEGRRAVREAEPTWPTLAEWRAERDTPAFLARFPWIGARRQAALEAEELAGVGV